MNKPINIKAKFDLFKDHWSPKVIAEMNNGLIDSKFMVPWENFKNTLMVTNSDGLNKISTRIYKIIKID